ncbi:cadherin EGF LAG seven-pass G-type receptor 1-like [Pecten maximus]|uniref:cadherin EGF LAG seven-pass G-type receptor 1-like n=1 Tax=Pecten maximus TaxID=6579 RepID=UPI0014588E21|nr:cadherin EGF LAG seven-pass G-type receptor 1-like [Pecten maximus]
MCSSIYLEPSAFVFAKPVYTVNEDAGAITVTVNRIGSTYGAVTVTWVTTDISAKYDSDFLNNGGTLFFGHGVSSVSIIISIVVDKVYEVDENFKIMLTKVTPNGALGVLTTTIVNIINDDKACGGPCGINAFCDMPSQKCVCNKGYIRWQGVCGLPCGGKCCAYSYCSPKDNKCHCNPGYIGNPTEKCYKPCNNACKKYAFCGSDNKCRCKTGYYGNPYQDCHLPCHDQCHKSKNTKCDIPSQRCVCLPGFFGNPLKGCQKPSVFVIAKSTYAVKESAQVVIITVNRIGASSEAVKVTWTATDVTAVHGHDYVNTGGILFFGSGDTSKTISIHITDDTVYEQNEQCRIELTRVTDGGIIGLQRKAIVIIENNDSRLSIFILHHTCI